MAAAAFWRAWSIWAISAAATATTITYSATHPLSAKLASFQVSRLDWVTAIVFVSAFTTVGALLAWKGRRIRRLSPARRRASGGAQRSRLDRLWKAKRDAGYSSNSVRIMRTVLCRALGQAVREGIVARYQPGAVCSVREKAVRFLPWQHRRRVGREGPRPSVFRPYTVHCG